MFTFFGAIRFSLQKKVCHNSDIVIWEEKETNDHSLDFLYYF